MLPQVRGAKRVPIGIAMGPGDPLLLALEVLHQVQRVLVGDSGPEFPAQLSFDPAQKIELGIGGLIDPATGCLGHLVFVERRDELRRHEYDRLGLDRCDRDVAEPGPTKGRSPSPGKRDELAVVLSWIRPAIASVCPSRNWTTVGRTADRRFPVPDPSQRGRSVGVVESADYRLDIESDHIAGEDLGDEVEDRAVRAKLMETRPCRPTPPPAATG